MIYWLQLPALVTPELPEPGVLTEGVLVDWGQEDRADVQVLEVHGATEHVSLHCPKVATQIEDAKVVHAFKAWGLQHEGATDEEWPALEGEIERVDKGSSDCWRNRSQLVLGEVEVFQHVQLFEKVFVDNSDKASPEDEVFEVWTHAREVVVGVSEDGEDVPGKVEPLYRVSDCHVDPNGHQIEIIIAQAQAGELRAGDAAQGEAHRCPVQAGLCETQLARQYYDVINVLLLESYLPSSSLLL